MSLHRRHPLPLSCTRLEVCTPLLASTRTYSLSLSPPSPLFLSSRLLFAFYGRTAPESSMRLSQESFPPRRRNPPFAGVARANSRSTEWVARSFLELIVEAAIDLCHSRKRDVITERRKERRRRNVVNTFARTAFTR